MPAWREWLLGNRGRKDGRTAVALAADVWERAGNRSAAILPALAEVEATARQVYADHGLPTRSGHYRRALDEADLMMHAVTAASATQPNTAATSGAVTPIAALVTAGPSGGTDDDGDPAGRRLACPEGGHGLEGERASEADDAFGRPCRA